jgi:hypothetical protein
MKLAAFVTILEICTLAQAQQPPATGNATLFLNVRVFDGKRVVPSATVVFSESDPASGVPMARRERQCHGGQRWRSRANAGAD